MDGFSAYLLFCFHKQTDIKPFQKKLVSFSKQYVQPELDKMGAPNYGKFLVEPVTDVHFSQGKHGSTRNSSMQLLLPYWRFLYFIDSIAELYQPLHCESC